MARRYSCGQEQGHTEAVDDFWSYPHPGKGLNKLHAVDLNITLRRQSRVVVEKHTLRTGSSYSCGQGQGRMDAILSPSHI